MNSSMNDFAQNELLAVSSKFQQKDLGGKKVVIMK